jgi:hypothetical protein
MIIETAAQLKEFVRTAKTRQSCIYHSGFLLVDREPSPDQPHDDKWCALRELAEAAWQLYEEGKIVLTQRRLADDKYEYIATRIGAR